MQRGQAGFPLQRKGNANNKMPVPENRSNYQSRNETLGRLEGKCIVVTGASRGLGLSIARRCVAEGAQIIAVARNAERLAAAITPLGECAVAITGDLAVAADVQRVFAAAERRFGKLDVLINNAAVYEMFSIEEATVERVRAILDANLLAPILCIGAATPLLRKAGGGDIINITSEGAVNTYALTSVYSASKAGLETLSRGLRAELRADRIRVTAFRLGGLKDAGALSPEMLARYLEANPAVKFASPNSTIDPDSAAQALVDVLALPADTGYELVDLKSRG
jgi:meso-butanediol dehydrogenase/(S,S)-butanediol dehydrogenase/diacetyl reductase